MKDRRRSSGFTVVELVATLLLVGILAAAVSSRWFGGSTFKSSTTAAELLSVARLAQRVALARPTVDITLEITRASGQWQFAVQQDNAGTVTLIMQSQSSNDLNISVTGTSGPVALGSTVDFILTFDALGNANALALGGVANGTVNGVSIVIGSTHASSLCVSPLGFAHGGTCV